VFVPPTNGWLVGAATSPDGQTVALAYGPPPPEGKVQLGYTDLYLMSADGSALPAPRLERTQVAESYFSPIWSPDGKYLYYVHFAGLPDTLTPPPELPYKYTLERLPDPTSADTPPEVILESAIWPAISPDGTKLAYVAVDLANYQNDLYLANADGSGALSLLPPGTFQAIDSPLFSPDGSAIIFSAVGEGPQSEAEGSSLSWLDRLLGVQVASAHNVPSDWWRVPVAGGPPERLTKIYDTGLYGDFALDGQYIAYLSVNGLYVMTPDGKEITSLLNMQVIGTLEWVP
jgi:Tol biopolymer transport system component